MVKYVSIRNDRFINYKRQFEVLKKNFMDFSHEISLLRVEKQKAVKNLDFLKAEQIEENIKILQESSKSYSKSTKTADLNNNFERDKQDIIREANQIASTYTQGIYNLRASYQKNLIELRGRQAKEMTELTTNLSKELELCCVRGIPQVAQLERDAKMQATRSNFSLANSLLEESKRIRVSVIEERQNSIHELYIARQEKLIAKHELQNKQFTQKINTDILDMYTKFNRCMAILKQRYLTQATKYNIPITEEDANQLISQFHIDDELGDEDEIAQLQMAARAAKQMNQSLNNSKSNTQSSFNNSSILSESLGKKPITKGTDVKRKNLGSSTVSSCSSKSSTCRNQSNKTTRKKTTAVTPVRK